MYGIIYKTTYLPTGEWYVGKHKCSSDEFDGYIGSGKIIRDFKKTHTAENFKRTTIAIAETLEDLNNLEIFYIEALNCINDPNCWNVSTGGEGNDYWNDEETANRAKTKMSESAKARDPETRTVPPRFTTEELVARFDNYWNGEDGKQHREEMASRIKSYWESEEGKARKAAGPIFTKVADCRKPVECIESGAVYESVKAAAESIGLTACAVGMVCKGQRKTAGGLHWRFTNQERG